MRIVNGALILVLVSCSAEPATEDIVSQAKFGDKIECALGGRQSFEKVCAIDRGEGSLLTLRHSDGGFRRLTLEPDGTIDTADGADILIVKALDDGRAEITIDDDRYLLPATL
jgi:hypothetical protein